MTSPIALEQGRTWWISRGTATSAWVRQAIPMMGVGVLYFAGAKIGLTMAFLQANVTPVWPPTGIALAGLLRFGTGVWPGITIAAFLATYATGVAATTAGIVAVGNTMAPLAAAYALTRRRRAPFDLASAGDVVVFIGMAALSTTLSATIGTLALTTTGVIGWSAAPACWWTWWVGDALGMLLVTPVLLGFVTPRRSKPDARTLAELAALAGTLIVTCGVIFWREPSASAPTYSLAYLVLPAAIWASLRFEVRGTAAMFLFVATVAIWSTTRGLGPFAGHAVTRNLIELDVFLAVVGLPSLVLAAITEERRNALDSLRASDRRHRLLFERNPLPMWLYDEKTLEVLDANDAALTHYGYSRTEFLALRVPDLWATAEYSPGETNGALAGGEPCEIGLHRHIRKDGTWSMVDVVREDASWFGPNAWLLLAHDVTERVRSDEALRQSQKMEAVGMLAGGIAHDFNNMLTVITSYGAMLLEEPEPGERWREDLGEIQQAAARAATLTRQLLAFSRQQVLQPRVLRLNETINETERMLRRLIRADIDFSLRLDPDLGPVTADPGQIEQVLMNLAVNAGDAMPDGGTITIETCDVSIDGREDPRIALPAPGGYALLAVSDNGVGMSADRKARIFEPFFTTKGRGEGTGLGLSTVYGIVKQSGGHIFVDSAIGRGTSFRIYLPLVEPGRAD